MKKTLLLLLAFALALAPGLGAEVKCSGSPCIDPVPVPADATSVTWTGIHLFNNATNTPATMADGVIDSTLTAGRVTFAGASGRLSDDADLTFATDTLSATKLTVATTLTSPNLVSAAGSNEAISATAPAATTGASQAGKAVTINASNAVASTDTDSAAAGGSVTITAGNAARRGALTNAAGGSINLVTGSGIGSGVAGSVVVPLGTSAVPSIKGVGSTYGAAYGSNFSAIVANSSYALYATASTLNLTGPVYIETAATSGVNAALYYALSVETVATTKAPARNEMAEMYTNGADVDGQAITLYDDPPVGMCHEFALTSTDTSNSFAIAPSAGETLMDGATTCATSFSATAKGSTARICAVSGGSGGLWLVMSKNGTWTCS